MRAVAAEQEAAERMSIKVALTIEHLVWVKLDGDSAQSMEDLKAAALAEYHRDPNKIGNRRSDDSWRSQFSNRSNIEVGTERVRIASVTVTPR